MGRTLHYEVKGTYKPTDEQENKLIKLSKLFNQRFNWTCENVLLSSLDYFPKWSHFPKDLNREDVWNLINKSHSQYISQGRTECEAIRSLHSDGMVDYTKKDSLRGFTKVAGNELNAHTVIIFIVEASRILPNQVFSLYDEGDALYCPILIRNGKAKPDLEQISSALDYWMEKDYLHDGGCWDVSNAERYYHSLLRHNPTWGDIARYIRPLVKSGKPKPFKTTSLHMEEMPNLNDLVEEFLLNEQQESGRFYEDVKQYPQLEVLA